MKANITDDIDAVIEIKIKTSDYHTYSLRVNRQMPVPLFRERVASVTGVPEEQQRLICLGRVLKDHELLSAYHVEDGHAMHLVARVPIPPASESLSNATDPNCLSETSTMTSHDGRQHLNPILRAFFQALHFDSVGTENDDEDEDEPANELGGDEGAISASGMAASTEQAGTSNRSDALTILIQYLSRMRQQYNINVGNHNINNASQDQPLPQQVELPTAERLANVSESTRALVIDQAAQLLQELAEQLENQSHVAEIAERLNIQSRVFRGAILLQNLGTFLIELGRATMTLHMVPEATLNAATPFLISESGPHPLIVPPFPFQVGTSLDAVSTQQSNSGLLDDATDNAAASDRIATEAEIGSSSSQSGCQPSPPDSKRSKTE